MSDAAVGKVALQVKFVSIHDPDNVQAFSGTIFHMAKAIQEVLPDVELVRAARPNWFETFETRIRRITNERINPSSWRWLNRYFARRLVRRWGVKSRVVILTVVASPLAAELATFRPVIHISDATFDLMRDFYPAVAKLAKSAADALEDAERRCILGAVHNCFSSRWAALSAVTHYGASDDEVSVISWGCNIPDVPASEVRAASLGKPQCKLLFLGADWARKGGDVAVASAEILISRGVPVHLDIVGSTPPTGVPDVPWITSHGFLKKSNAQDVASLTSLIREADFLFLPTHQDCTPMVFAEANAYGTPAVTRDVGGVADVVRDGKNGIVLPERATAADFADAIESTWQDRSYAQLRQNARREYENRLNWHSWAKAIAGQVENLALNARI